MSRWITGLAVLGVGAILVIVSAQTVPASRPATRPGGVATATASAPASRAAAADPEAKIAQAKADLRMIKTALSTHELVHDRFPTTEEGLVVLVATMKNVDPKFPEKIPLDPWGHAYVYRNPGMLEGMDLSSMGPDGRDGTSDDILSGG